MANTIKNSIKTRKIAIIATDGVNENALMQMKKALENAGAVVEIIATKQGALITENGTKLPIDASLLTSSSVLYDAVFVPGGKKSIDALMAEPDAIHFLNEAYKHCKAIALSTDAKELLNLTYFAIQKDKNEEKSIGVVVGEGEEFIQQFIKAIAGHRFWERETERKVPA